MGGQQQSYNVPHPHQQQYNNLPHPHQQQYNMQYVQHSHCMQPPQYNMQYEVHHSHFVQQQQQQNIDGLNNYVSVDNFISPQRQMFYQHDRIQITEPSLLTQAVVVPAALIDDGFDYESLFPDEGEPSLLTQAVVTPSWIQTEQDDFDYDSLFTDF